MKTQAAFVRAECAVKLDAKAPVDLYFTFVIPPGYTEDNLTLRLADALNDFVLSELRMFDQDRAE